MAGLKVSLEKITEYQMNRELIKFFNQLFGKSDVTKYPKVLGVMKEVVQMLIRRMPDISTTLLGTVSPFDFYQYHLKIAKTI